MWNENSTMEWLQGMSFEATQENLQSLQNAIDVDKFCASCGVDYDLCGTYAPFCRNCNKDIKHPCANAYCQMMAMERAKADLQAEVAVADATEEKGITLKETRAQAAALSMAHAHDANAQQGLSLSKKTVTEWLANTFGDKVYSNTKQVNYTKTGLPLPDTHYGYQGNKKACFLYVYELADGTVFFLVKTTNETAKAIAQKHASFRFSAFPKTHTEVKWYSMIVDDTYQTNQDVFGVLAQAYNGLFLAE